MSDKAIEVIASTLEACDGGDYDQVAKAILGTLKAARFAVVELPEPAESMHETDRHAFPNETHCGVRVTFSGGVVYDGDHYHPSEARSLGAAFLAAAEAVTE